MEVQVEIAPSPGLRVAPIEPQLIPPLGRRQVNVSAEVTRAGQFTVQASVRTPGGELLGPPSRLRMRSTAYGTITLWLTGSAGVLLVVLTVRRVIRRVRGEPPRRREIVLGPPGGRPSPAEEPPPTSPVAMAQVPPTTPVPTMPVPAARPPAATGPGPRTGDPFPDPTSATDRLPAARKRPRPGPPRPPEPPRVGSR
jgi:hypothetical protein